MSINDVVGRVVEGPSGQMIVSAMYAAVAPELGGPSRSNQDRFMGELLDEQGRRFTGLVVDGRVEHLDSE